MSVVARYINRMFFVRLAVVMFAVVGFGLMFDLIENAESVLRAAGARRWPVLDYSLLRLPVILAEMLPLVTLVAAILTVGDLLRHRELVIMWGSGVSPLAMVRKLLPIGLVLLGMKLALDDVVVPRVSAELREWAVGDYRRSTLTGGTGSHLWLRSGDDVVRIDRSAAAVGRVASVTVFRRDAEGLLLERLDASHALPTAAGWRLIDVTRRTVGTPRTETLPELLWPGAIALDQLALVAREPRELSLGQLQRVIASAAFSIRSTDVYLTWVHVRLANAIVPFLLVVLAFGLARRFSRTGTLAPIFLRGIAIGFGFHIAQGLAVALGEVGFLDPQLAGWALPLGLAAGVLGPPILAEARLARAGPAPA